MFKHHRHHHRFNMEAFDSEEHQKRKKRGLLFWGVVLILAGLLFLANNFGWIAFDFPWQFFSWKLVFVVLSINFLLSKRWVGATIMAFFALFFYAPEILGQDLWEYKKKLWPLIPIFIGAIFLSKMTKKKSKLDLSKCTPMETKTVDNNMLDETLIMSGSSKKINSYDFKGGKITTVMGGLEVDLTNCTLSNNHAVIEIVSVMGGVSLTVPREWNVKLDVVPVLGGVDDHIYNTPQAYVDPAAELVIRGTVVMGGVEINRA